MQRHTLKASSVSTWSNWTSSSIVCLSIHFTLKCFRRNSVLVLFLSTAQVIFLLYNILYLRSSTISPSIHRSCPLFGTKQAPWYKDQIWNTQLPTQRSFQSLSVFRNFSILCRNRLDLAQQRNPRQKLRDGCKGNANWLTLFLVQSGFKNIKKQNERYKKKNQLSSIVRVLEIKYTSAAASTQ